MYSLQFRLYQGFLGRILQKKYCHIHHAIVSAMLEAILNKVAAIFKVIRLCQKLRGTESSISILCLDCVGHSLQKKVLLNTSSFILSHVSVICINHSDVNGGHFIKMAAVLMNNVIYFCN